MIGYVLNNLKSNESFFFLTVAVSLGVIGYLCYELQSPKSEPLNPAVLANIDALTEAEGEDGGGLDCSYDRETNECYIYVGIKGSVELFGFGVLYAGADGYVRVKAEVICKSGGNSTCTPFECFQLYSLIKDSERS